MRVLEVEIRTWVVIGSLVTASERWLEELWWNGLGLDWGWIGECAMIGGRRRR